MSFVRKLLFGEAPPAPDYAAAATAQGEANLDAAKLNAAMNRLNETNPYGSVKYSSTPNANTPGGLDYSRQISFSPEQQRLYDLETQGQIARGQIGNSMQGALASSVSQPFSLSQFKDLGDASSYAGGAEAVGKALYDRLTALRKPGMQRDEAGLDNRLRNQGLVPGTEAYNVAMEELRQSQGQELNDLAGRAVEAQGQEQSRLAGLDQSLQQSGIQKYILGRTQPLAEYNSFMTGAQPTLPQFQPYGMTNTQAAPVYNATNDQYKAQLGAYGTQGAQTQSLLNFAGNFFGG